MFAAFTLTPALSAASTQTAKLYPRATGQSSHFGITVGVSGDVAVVGLNRTDELDRTAQGGQLRTAVVHERVDGRWHRRASLAPPAPEGWFATSLDVAGDSIAVPVVGGIYVFTRRATTWRQDAFIPVGPGFPSDVAIDQDTIAATFGDESGSAVEIAVREGGGWRPQGRLVLDSVGALALDGDRMLVAEGSPQNGETYLFERIDGSWEQVQTLRPDGAELTDFFGRSVALQGDVAVIGAPGDGEAGESSGAVYVYVRRGGAWELQDKLFASDSRANLQFGYTVDLDADTILVGHAGSASFHGTAYVFNLIDGEWLETEMLVPADPGGGEGDYSFQSVALDGDTALLGAPWHDDAAVDGGAVDVFDLHPAYRLECPGDINGDGVPDLVVSRANGLVTARDVRGSLTNEFSLASRAVIDVELMPDNNGNGAPELALLSRRPLQTQVHDLLTGGELARTRYDPEHEPFDLETLPDLTGNGAGELTALDGTPVDVRVDDGLTGQTLARPTFSRYTFGQDLAVYPDLNGDGAPELAVLGEHSQYERSDKLEVRSLAGALVQEIWFGTRARVLQQRLIADGIGHPEVAVLRTEERSPSDVIIRDIHSRQRTGVIRGEVHYPVERWFAIDDLNGNRSQELVLFARREGVGNQKLRVIDTRTRQILQTFYVDRNALAQDVVACPDLNGNGTQEVALLGRTRDGRIKVIVHDAATGQRVTVVKF